MSIKLLEDVWDRDLKRSELNIALRLAGFANEDGHGVNIYAGEVAHKVGCSASTVLRVLKNWTTLPKPYIQFAVVERIPDVILRYTLLVENMPLRKPFVDTANCASDDGSDIAENCNLLCTKCSDSICNGELPGQVSSPLTEAREDPPNDPLARSLDDRALFLTWFKKTFTSEKAIVDRALAAFADNDYTAEEARMVYDEVKGKANASRTKYYLKVLENGTRSGAYQDLLDQREAEKLKSARQKAKRCDQATVIVEEENAETNLPSRGKQAPPAELPVYVDRSKSHPDAQELWQAACDELKLEITSTTFRTHVEPCRLINIVDDEIVIATPTNYSLEWLRDRLKSTVDRILTGFTGRPFHTRFVYGRIVDEGSPEAEALNAT